VREGGACEGRKKKDSFDFSSEKFLLRETNIFLKPNLSLVARHSSLLATTLPDDDDDDNLSPPTTSLFFSGLRESRLATFTRLSPQKLLGFLSLLIHISPAIHRAQCQSSCAI
jgi:hypothetical protein